MRDLVDFALALSIAPASAYVLPALFDHSAKAVGMTRGEFIAECGRNPKLAVYMAECAAKVAAQDAGEVARQRSEVSQMRGQR